MSKRRISEQQARKIAANQAKRITESTSTDCQGRLIAHHGINVEIMADTGEVVHCTLRQNIAPLVAGDKVAWQPNSDLTEGVVTALLPRSSLLYRGHEEKLVAANVDQMVVVIAPKPAPGALTLDRYLVAASFFDLSVLLVLNKTDMLVPSDPILETLRFYESLGYKTLQTHTHTPEGLTALREALSDKTSVLVGQSGVGKSSIVNQLIQTAATPTGGLTASEHGRHTTSVTRVWHLDTGGCLIDSPGVRQFWVTQIPQAQLSPGFIEFRPFLGTCKFRNCRHENDKGCAILAAVQRGEISQERLKRFYQLRDENNAYHGPNS